MTMKYVKDLEINERLRKSMMVDTGGQKNNPDPEKKNSEDC